MPRVLPRESLQLFLRVGKNHSITRVTLPTFLGKQPPGEKDKQKRISWTLLINAAEKKNMSGFRISSDSPFKDGSVGGKHNQYKMREYKVGC